MQMTPDQREPAPARAARALGPAPVLFACLFAAQAAFLTLAPILPELASEFDVSTATAGQLETVAGLSGGLTAVAIAVLGGRVVVRQLLPAGLALLAAGSLGSALAPSFALLLVAQLLLGAGMSAVISGGVAAAAEWSSSAERPRVLSWALLGQPASWVAGMPLIGLAAGAGWRFAWVALPLASSVLALLAVHARARAAAASTRSERSAQRGSQPGTVALWRRPDVSRWALGELFTYTAWNGTLVYAGTLLIDSYNLSLATAGLILGLSAAAYFPGSLVARRHVDSHARALLISLGLAAALITAAFGAVRPGPAFSAALLALLMALAGARGLAGSALGLQIAPRQRVQITGVRAAGVQFGGLLGAGLGGAALAAGSYPGLGAVLALAFAMGVLPHLVIPTADRRAPSVAA